MSVLKAVLIVGATLLFEATAAALFIGSGAYDIGADDHHTKLTFAIIEQLRERSIAARDGAIPAQPVLGPERIKAGAARYAALCAGCHLAPGVTKSDIRPGLYPHPPNLAQGEVQNPQRAFWIIKHGIKMTAMPAWGKTLNDAAIWDMVAFVRAMPDLTPQMYQLLSQQPCP
jgi:mono/diheme cytochrome c family protein